MLYLFALCAGLGHGIIEAVINPICAAVYPKEKTKWLTILHAAWPAGLVFGTLAIIGTEGTVDGLMQGPSWRPHALWIVVPAIAYAILYLPCRFPVDERVKAGVPYMEMLRQVGALSASIAAFLMIYEIGNQVDTLTGWEKPDQWFEISMGSGVGVGLFFGLWVRSLGRPLFFLMCLLMIPLATAELGTDAWIQKLMKPVLADMEINAAFALVFSASIMLFFRVFAGGILQMFSPPALLCLSGVFSAAGLWWLSDANGTAIFTAFVIYALGQTYYWPCVLGFVSERYPHGGALTLNTVSAIGLLSVGVIGGQVLGVAFDKSIHQQVATEAPLLAKASEADKKFLGMRHKAILPAKKKAFLEAMTDAGEKDRLNAVYMVADERAGRDVLSYAVRFPAILFLAFGIITLYFRSRGGYKPIELEQRE